MVRRSEDWNKGLAEDMRDPAFAAEFILELLELGESLQCALGKVVRTYGVKEFAEVSGIAAPNILRAIDPTHNPTQLTLDKLLAPFGLEVTARIKRKRKKSAA